MLDDENSERLSLRLPLGLKQEWKEKARKRKFSSIWTYIKDLVENDVEDNEFTPESLKKIEKLSAENQLLREKLDILTEKIISIEELMTTKTIMRKMINKKIQNQILNFIGPGKKTSEIAIELQQDEIITLGTLDSLEGLGKIRYEPRQGLWKLIE